MSIPSSLAPFLHPADRYPGIVTHTGILHLDGIDLYVEHHLGAAADPHAIPLLALHGVGGSSAQLWPEITRIGQDRPVIALDFRGHGRSTRPAAYTLDDHVADALAVVAAFELSRFAVLGYSMGSYVAPGVARATRPGSAAAEAVGLIAAVSRLDGKVSGTVALMQRRAADFAGVEPERVREVLAGFLHSPSASAAALQRVREFTDIPGHPELELSPEQYELANAALAGFDNSGVYADLDLPVLVISGADDELNPPAEGARVARAAEGAQFVTVPGAGHLMSVERPDEYTEPIRRFLNGLGHP
ncbi:alpha/beta hydrolase [Brevibacterium sp. 91QC2O2]|uniref:alpha/beta fold hydrolase n=1 Tax=Brevibacterium TaxID=1696 RepID=UPI00211BD41E|nr:MULTISPECIES: alpha/beta hydrolase [unclassified Brevibacterium]MCQ9367166.1 alpha/beta hydrolase [Brevibacterium sp. 91QC2O2]MCQ9385698.1 alpha/beta hydrolase [Brevibacterium sp. 68QC2CO]